MPFTFEENSIVVRIAGGFGGGGVDAENAGTLLVAQVSAISAGDGLQFTDDGDQTVTLEIMGTLEVENAPGTRLLTSPALTTREQNSTSINATGVQTLVVQPPGSYCRLLSFGIDCDTDGATGTLDLDLIFEDHYPTGNVAESVNGTYTFQGNPQEDVGISQIFGVETARYITDRITMFEDGFTNNGGIQLQVNDLGGATEITVFYTIQVMGLSDGQLFLR